MRTATSLFQLNGFVFKIPMGSFWFVNAESRKGQTYTHPLQHAHTQCTQHWIPEKEAGDVAQWLRMYTALTEESQVQFPPSTLGNSLSPAALPERNPFLSS